jgi:hypothetical protein
MKRALVVVVLIGLTANANADERTKWKVALAGSLAVTVGGGVFAYRGMQEIDRIHEEQCAHGAGPGGFFFNDCVPAMLPPYTAEQVDASNRAGDRVARQVNIGYAVALVGVIGTGFSIYKLATVKPAQREPRTAFTPTVSKHGAGAALTLRW